MTTGEQISSTALGSEPAEKFIDSYLRRRRQAENAFEKEVDRDSWRTARYGTPRKIDPTEVSHRRTPLLSELTGDSYERELHRGLFLGAILLGSARRQEGIALDQPLNASDVRKYDELASAIEAGEPTPDFTVDTLHLQYARELVEGLAAKNHAAEPIATAAHLAIQDVFRQQSNSVT